MLKSLARFLETPTGRGLRYAVSLALIVGFAWSIDWRELGRLRGEFDRGDAWWALLLAGLTYPLHAVRWWVLVRALGLSRSFSWTHWVTWICQFYNGFLLGGLGGDVARVYYLYRDEPEHKAAGLFSLFLDRVMGLAVLMSLAALALVTRAGQLANDSGLRWIFPIALTLLVGALIGTLLLVKLRPERWPAFLKNFLGPERLHVVTDLLERFRRSTSECVQALVVSYAIWLLDFVAVWLLARAVGLPLPFLDTCIAVSVAYAATALPISVGGHGIREGALLLTLSAFGLLAVDGSRDRALLLAILVWACTVLWSLVGGAVLLFHRDRSPQSAP